MVAAEDETVLAAAAGGVIEGQRGSRAAKKAGLDACAFFPEIEQPPADGQPMYEATRELVPEGARILRADDASCGTAGSCRFEYEIGGGVAARLNEARARLRARGWTNVRSGRTPTVSSWLMASRNDYAAVVEVAGEVLPAHCAQRKVWGCSDSVWVHRIEVPDILTGDTDG